jgi:hypothetical protein
MLLDEGVGFGLLVRSGEDQAAEPSLVEPGEEVALVF